MSDSEEGVLQIDLDRPEKSSPSYKKYKLKRSDESLVVKPTDEEMKYRIDFLDFDVVKDFPELLKCTKCFHSFKSAVLEGQEIYSHPILRVLLCESCCSYYGNGEFSLDEDGEDKYCRWCGEGGKIYLCSECICGFCPTCIKKHFGKQRVKEIEKDDEWKCFICNPKPLWKLRVVCHLARTQSRFNQTRLEAETKNNTGKKLKYKGFKESKPTENSACVETTNNKGDSSKEDSPCSSKETQASSSRQRHSKRKLFLASNSKGKEKKASANEGSDDVEEPPKKMRFTRSRTAEKMKVNQKRKIFNVSSSSSSDSSDDENENNNTAKFGELHKKKISLIARSKNKNLSKLKDIFRVAETVSELCLTMCRKKIKKLEKNLLSDEKLMSECEKLKSMIILMSCSLSTVHNLIISLQEKCKVKDKLDVQYRGIPDPTLLEAIGKILRDKRVKTSYFSRIVSDILNRYPFIELGAQSFSNYVSSSVTKENNLECTENGTCQNDIENSAREQDETNERSGNSNKEIHGSAETVTSDDILNLDSDTMKVGLEKVTPETEVSTHVLETDGDHVSSNNELPGPSTEVKNDNVLSTISTNPFDMPLDMDKLYLESLKLREELLKTSSDESLSDEEESAGVGNLLRLGSSTVAQREAKSQPSSASANKSEEEQEISKLMNLSCLEHSREKKISGSDPGENDLEEECHKKIPNGSNSPKVTMSDTSNIMSDFKGGETPSCDLSTNKKHESNIEYVLENASVLKNYFLETTSSSNDDDENRISGENRKRKRRLTKTSSEDEKQKSNKKEKEKSGWRLDNLLRASLNFPASKGNSGGQIPKEDNSKNSMLEVNASDSSLSSLYSNLFIRPNRSRPLLLTSTTDSDVEQELPPQSALESPQRGRRNIKKIVKTGNLQLETRQAVKAENERKKRVAERQAVYEELFPNMLESERLVLDFDQDTKEVLLEVPTEFAQKLKPHQKEGVKFMWDCCFESLDSLEQSNGTGCVLAHCMGLGKSLQIIALIFTVMKNGIGIETILILCPLNVVSNWINEFKIWLSDIDFNINVYNLNHIKGDNLRIVELQKWKNEGGVMIVSYDLMRNLTNSNRKSKVASDSTSLFTELLLNPGPDLVICDEGHLLKNQDTALSKSLTRINTSRRIILTGTPLQNNLVEYHSMIQFVKPNILGTKKEFMNRFGNPIMNGQFEDSTAKDVKLMRARSHVLHKLLDGCIQRFSYSVLTPYLPKRHEYVLSVRLTPTQAKLYQYYLDKCRKSWTSNKTAKLFSDFHLLRKVWTHPKLLVEELLYDEEFEDQLNSELAENKVDSSSDDSVICLDPDIRSSVSSPEDITTFLRPEEYENIESSCKLVLLFHILSACRKVGDKVLVFSQSLINLNLIEYFLNKMDLANKTGSSDIPAQYRDTWEKGVDYFRMEGSTSYEARTRWCKSFNCSKDKRSRLFLISTKAGGIGINLVGANRVIIFDVSWNPSQDVQSIFRIYRFGQTKTCYIYRFVAEGTMEEKIYARQVTKMSLEKRVLDEEQIERHYTMGNLQELYSYDPMPAEKWKVPLIPKDRILAEIINNKNLIASYHELDSLLENKEEEKLTEEERKAAWDDFERERFMTEHQLNNRFTATNTHPSATITQPSTSNTYPSATITQPSTSNTYPSATITQPSATNTHPSTSNTDLTYMVPTTSGIFYAPNAATSGRSLHTPYRGYTSVIQQSSR